MFHGPKVSLDPPWLEANDNSFGMRVIDCAQFCADTFLFECGNDAAKASKSVDIDKQQLRDSMLDPHVESCLLGFPKNVSEICEGPQALAMAMEEFWNIFLFDGYFYFTRKWSGELRHRAKVEFYDHAMFVTEVATNSKTTCELPWPDAYSIDQHFGVRQVDFLIKALLYNMPCPAPLPNNASSVAGVLALQVLTEYGRIGSYPTSEDTTEYRICLNGTHGRFRTSPDNLPLVKAIKAFTENCDPDRHARLYEAFRNRSLLFPFKFPDEVVRKRAVTDQTPTEFMQRRDWHGQRCFFAYTDATYRLEPSHGCISIPVRDLTDFIRQHDECACVVINPDGPATCRLEQSDIHALAEVY